MATLQPEEPSILIERKASLNVKKIRFEVNRVKLPIGINATFGVIRHPGAALAVPITIEGNVVILRQYRFAISRRILEFPAGTLEEGEEPLTSMKRELAEEAGYKASRWDSLGQMVPCPGYSDEIIHLYLARELEQLAEQPQGDEDEDLEVVIMPPKELDETLAKGEEMLDSKSVTAWHQAKKILGL